jgi:hypothetical protein
VVRGGVVACGDVNTAIGYALFAIGCTFPHACPPQADPVHHQEAQIAVVQSEATGRVQAEKQQLDEVEKCLNAELKRLTGGLAPGIKLPKIKL